ncbi:hypothetical protein ON010_g15346 [Phytophthora cinnamomi]|nr:hypothetical protein ON010_g15346 [Phytophthora cinnamomi]
MIPARTAKPKKTPAVFSFVETSFVPESELTSSFCGEKKVGRLVRITRQTGKMKPTIADTKAIRIHARYRCLYSASMRRSEAQHRSRRTHLQEREQRLRVPQVSVLEQGSDVVLDDVHVRDANLRSLLAPNRPGQVHPAHELVPVQQAVEVQLEVQPQDLFLAEVDLPVRGAPADAAHEDAARDDARARDRGSVHGEVDGVLHDLLLLLAQLGVVVVHNRHLSVVRGLEDVAVGALLGAVVHVHLLAVRVAGSVAAHAGDAAEARRGEAGRRLEAVAAAGGPSGCGLVY